MEKFIVGKNAHAYYVSGKIGNDNHSFVRAKETIVREGRTFVGRLMFVRMPYGFIPMIQIMDYKSKRKYYFYPDQVKRVKNATDVYAVPRAGQSNDFGMKSGKKNPYQVQAGEIKGDIHTAPTVGDMMNASNFSGADGNTKWEGVQAGQIYYNENKPSNPYQVRGGEIEGVVDTDSYEYFSGFNNVQAGTSHNYGVENKGNPTNPIQVKGGGYQGFSKGMPQSYNYIGGDKDFQHSQRYPNLRHYTLANPNVDSELVDYSLNYPQYIDANFSGANGGSFMGLQGGQSFNYGTTSKGANPYQVQGGEYQGFKRGMPQSYSYANGNNEALTKEEMDALHKDKDKKGGKFWDWLKSDDAKKLASDSIGIGKTLFNQSQEDKLKNQGGGTSVPLSTDSPTALPQQKETQILGMHPLTFGIVAVGSLALITTIIIVVKKSK